MFAFVRKYSNYLFFLLATLFCFSLLVDEVGDYNRELQDLQVIASVEYSADDMDWNEIDDMAECQTPSYVNSIKKIWNEYLPILYFNGVQRSDEQWRGLVRRYAPRKVFLITNISSYNGTIPIGIVPFFFSK
ncbi:MAG: hypothetical protein IJL38_08310 [Bacteroidales bacterium]|nr:hypothetical protein [Bacteroidales bacterium]